MPYQTKVKSTNMQRTLCDKPVRNPHQQEVPEQVQELKQEDG